MEFDKLEVRGSAADSGCQLSLSKRGSGSPSAMVIPSRPPTLCNASSKLTLGRSHYAVHHSTIAEAPLKVVLLTEQVVSLPEFELRVTITAHGRLELTPVTVACSRWISCMAVAEGEERRKSHPATERVGEGLCPPSIPCQAKNIY